MLATRTLCVAFSGSARQSQQLQQQYLGCLRPRLWRALTIAPGSGVASTAAARSPLQIFAASSQRRGHGGKAKRKSRTGHATSSSATSGKSSAAGQVEDVFDRQNKKGSGQSKLEEEEVQDGERSEFIVESDKQRLDVFLADSMPSASRARLQGLIKGGQVTVNGKMSGVKASLKLRASDHVVVTVPPPPPLAAQAEDIPLELVYEDDALVVVDKAAGMVVHPAPGNYTGTMVNALLHHCQLPTPDSSARASLDEEEEADSEGEEGAGEAGTEAEAADGAAAARMRPGIVHRLDKGTSGLIVVAKTAEAHDRLAQQFKDRTVRRSYFAIVSGVPKETVGRVATKIGRHPRYRKRMTALPLEAERGKRAVSNYEVLEVLANGAACLMLWRLETGRTHQIRVHAQHIGVPLLFDEVYGYSHKHLLSRLYTRKLDKYMTTCLKEERPALHAHELGFVHPEKETEEYFTSELPQDLKSTLEFLRSLSPGLER